MLTSQRLSFEFVVNVVTCSRPHHVTYLGNKCVCLFDRKPSFGFWLTGFSTRFFCGHVAGECQSLPLACHAQTLDLPHPNPRPATPKPFTRRMWQVSCAMCGRWTCHMCSWYDVFLFQHWQYLNIFKISVFNIVWFSFESSRISIFGSCFLFLVLFSLPFACFYVCWFQ